MKRKTQIVFARAMRRLFERLYKALHLRDWKRAARISSEMCDNETRAALGRIREPSPEQLKKALLELPLEFVKTQKDFYRAIQTLAPPRGGRPRLFSTTEQKRGALIKVRDLMFVKKYNTKAALPEVAEDYGVSLRTMQRLWAERDRIFSQETTGKGKTGRRKSP